MLESNQIQDELQELYYPVLKILFDEDSFQGGDVEFATELQIQKLQIQQVVLPSSPRMMI